VKARAVVLGGSVAGLGVTDEVKARAVVLGGGVVTALGAGVVVLTAACEIAAGPAALANKDLTGDGVTSFAAVGTAGRGGSAPATA
jgi:hypothetical protein